MNMKYCLVNRNINKDKIQNWQEICDSFETQRATKTGFSREISEHFGFSEEKFTNKAN